MSKKGSGTAIHLLESYIGAVKRGETPAIDAILAACPQEERADLRLAMLGARDLLECHWLTYVSPQTVEKTLMGMRRIRERYQQYQAAKERMTGLSDHLPANLIEAVREALDIPQVLIQNALLAKQRTAGLGVWARGERRQASRTNRFSDRAARAALEDRMADRAVELLERYDLSSIPVDLDALAQRLYLIVQEAPLKELDAYLVAGDDYGAIILNRHVTNRQRRRFTIAHEVAHFDLHRGMRVFQDKLDDQGSTVHDVQEQQADALAAMLLVPRPFFPREYAGQRPTFEHAEEVAAQFDVSLAAALRRLVRESHEACALVVVEDLEVKWWVESPEFEHFVRSGRVDRSTVAARLLSSPRIDHGTDRLPLSAWADPAEDTDPDTTVWEEARCFENRWVYSLITCLS